MEVIECAKKHKSKKSKKSSKRKPHDPNLNHRNNFKDIKPAPTKPKKHTNKSSHDTSNKNSFTTKDASKGIAKVKSSNIWGYKINIKDAKDTTGDVIVQFKGKNGGPDDLYIYYDVPVTLYRRWNSAPSKGHFFWVYIRDNFKYSKLTGNRRGVLPNAVN